MPQAAIAAIQGYLVVAGVNAAVAAFVAKVFVYAASTYLLNRASQALAPKQRSLGGVGRGIEANYYDSGASIRIIYGKVRTGGMETVPPLLKDSDNSLLTKVITHAGHEVTSYGDVYLDSDVVSSGLISPISYTPDVSNLDGAVGAGKYQNYAYIRRYTGSATDSVDYLMNVYFGFNGIAKGFAKTYVTFKYNDSIYRGVPVVTVVIWGKSCYDPRLDTSPGANPTNTAYSAWTDNPALCLCNYLMATYGGEYDSDEIDWDTVVTAANYCDGLVDIPGATTQKRYTCNGVLEATAEFDDNVKTLVDTMLGRLIFRDGKWRVYAGGWQSPTFTIQKSDWISSLSIKFEQGLAKRFNRMRCWYIDPQRDWQRVECLPRSNATYRTADGSTDIEAQIEQLLCNAEYEAQRKAEFLLRQSRNQITIAGRLPPRFQNIALWDTGTIVFDHLGWSSKTFRCVGCDMNPDGSMDVVFSEEQSTDWTDLDAADYNAPSTAALPATNVTTPSAPASLNVVTNINGTLGFEIGRPIVYPFNARMQIIRGTNSGNAAVGTVVYDGLDQRVNLVMPASRHWYWSRAYVSGSSGTIYGAYQPNTFGVLGDPLGFGSTQINSNAATDVRVSSSGAGTGPVFISGPNSQTVITNSFAYTNSLATAVAIQAEFSLLNAEVAYDVAPPAVARSAYVFTTNSSGSGETNIVSLYPDVLTSGSITPTAVLQMTLLGGDTIVVSMKHVLGHSNGASMDWNGTIVRLSAIKR